MKMDHDLQQGFDEMSDPGARGGREDEPEHTNWIGHRAKPKSAPPPRTGPVQTWNPTPASARPRTPAPETVRVAIPIAPRKADVVPPPSAFRTPPPAPLRQPALPLLDEEEAPAPVQTSTLLVVGAGLGAATAAGVGTVGVVAVVAALVAFAPARPAPVEEIAPEIVVVNARSGEQGPSRAIVSRTVQPGEAGRVAAGTGGARAASAPAARQQRAAEPGWVESTVNAVTALVAPSRSSSAGTGRVASGTGGSSGAQQVARPRPTVIPGPGAPGSAEAGGWQPAPTGAGQPYTDGNGIVVQSTGGSAYAPGSQPLASEAVAQTDEWPIQASGGIQVERAGSSGFAAAGAPGGAVAGSGGWNAPSDAVVASPEFGGAWSPAPGAVAAGTGGAPAWNDAPTAGSSGAVASGTGGAPAGSGWGAVNEQVVQSAAPAYAPPPGAVVARGTGAPAAGGDVSIADQMVISRPGQSESWMDTVNNVANLVTGGYLGSPAQPAAPTAAGTGGGLAVDDGLDLGVGRASDGWNGATAADDPAMLALAGLDDPSTGSGATRPSGFGPAAQPVADMDDLLADLSSDRPERGFEPAAEPGTNEAQMAALLADLERPSDRSSSDPGASSSGGWGAPAGGSPGLTPEDDWSTTGAPSMADAVATGAPSANAAPASTGWSEPQVQPAASGWSQPAPEQVAAAAPTSTGWYDTVLGVGSSVSAMMGSSGDTYVPGQAEAGGADLLAGEEGESLRGAKTANGWGATDPNDPSMLALAGLDDPSSSGGWSGSRGGAGGAAGAAGAGGAAGSDGVDTAALLASLGEDHGSMAGGDAAAAADDSLVGAASSWMGSWMGTSESPAPAGAAPASGGVAAAGAPAAPMGPPAPRPKPVCTDGELCGDNDVDSWLDDGTTDLLEMEDAQLGPVRIRSEGEMFVDLGASDESLVEDMGGFQTLMLNVTTDVPGIRAEIDGKEVGRTPLHAEVAPGRHVIRLYGGGDAVSVFTMSVERDMEEWCFELHGRSLKNVICR